MNSKTKIHQNQMESMFSPSQNNQESKWILIVVFIKTAKEALIIINNRSSVLLLQF